MAGGWLGSVFKAGRLTLRRIPFRAERILRRLGGGLGAAAMGAAPVVPDDSRARV